MPSVLGRRHRLLHVRSLLTRWYDREQEVHQVSSLTSFRFRTLTSGKVDHTVTDTERRKVIKKITLRINSKRSVRNDNSWAFTIDLSVTQWFETPVHDEDPRNDQIIWQQYIQQIESLSPENRVSTFCKEAGFMRVVEVGQYFVTKDTGSLRQFRSVACREYTLPRDDPASQAKGWIQGNMRIGPVLEVTTSVQNCKHGIEIRIWSVGQDNSQSWVRISYGTNKYVIDSNQNNT